MQTVTLSTKYQVDIPKKIRDTLQLKPGQKMNVIEHERTQRPINTHLRFSKTCLKQIKRPCPAALAGNGRNGVPRLKKRSCPPGADLTC